MNFNVFFPYQVEYIKDTSQFIAYEKARRIGITLASAYKSVTRGIQERSDHLVSSRDEKTGQEYMGYCRSFCDLINTSLGTNYIDLSKSTSEIIVLPSGSRIMRLTSSPGNFRGMGKGKTHVTLDEFAHHQDQAALFTAAKSCVDWGGTLELISTHSGIGTAFYDIIKQANAKKNLFKIFRTTLLDAANQGLCDKQPGPWQAYPPGPERIAAFMQARKDESISEAMFNEEYMCEVAGVGSLITAEMYDKCIIPSYSPARDNYNVSLDNCGALYVGIDVGRSKDNTMIWVIEQGEDNKVSNPKLRKVYRTILVKALKNMPFESQYQIICGLINHRKVKKVLIERNGIGAGLAEQLENTFPGKAQSWNTTAQNKGIAVERLSAFISQNRISMSPDADLKEDILAMKRVISPTGKVAYDGQTSTSHCDGYISASLALEAAEGETAFFSMI